MQCKEMKQVSKGRKSRKEKADGLKVRKTEFSINAIKLVNVHVKWSRSPTRELKI